MNRGFRIYLPTPCYCAGGRPHTLNQPMRAICRERDLKYISTHPPPRRTDKHPRPPEFARGLQTDRSRDPRNFDNQYRPPISLVVPTLTSPSIHTHYLRNGHYRSLHKYEILRVLRIAPLLESLDLAVTSQDLMPEPDRDPILLHLRRIRLVGDIPACVYVLGHIIAPEDLRVCLEKSPIDIGLYIHPRTFRFPLPDASIESWPLRNDIGPFASCMLACGGDGRAAGVFTLRSGETKCSSHTSPTATSESRISSSISDADDFAIEALRRCTAVEAAILGTNRFPASGSAREQSVDDFDVQT